MILFKKITSADLIECFMKQRADSRWKFYKILDVEFHVYEMNTPIGKVNELPIHFKEGSNEKALINMMIIFVSGVVYHITKQNQRTQEILTKMKQ